MSATNLSGMTVLVVEDEYFQAMETKQWLEEAGARVVGPSGNPQEIAALLRAEQIDGAVVDLNLGDGANFAIPHELQERAIPMVLVTGYDAGTLPDDLTEVVRVTKPANAKRVVEAVRELMAAR